MESGPAASAEVGRPPTAPQVEDGEDPREQVGNRPARTASSIDGFDSSGLGVGGRFSTTGTSRSGVQLKQAEGGVAGQKRCQDGDRVFSVGEKSEVQFGGGITPADLVRVVNVQKQLVQLSSCLDQLSGRIERSRNQPEEDCLGNNSEVEVEQELARRDIIKLNPYDGESEVEIFLHLVKVCQHHNHWTDAQTKGHVEVALRGKAAEVEVGIMAFVYSPKALCEAHTKVVLDVSRTFKVLRKLTDVNYVVQKTERSDSESACNKMKKCNVVVPTEDAVEVEEEYWWS